MSHIFPILHVTAPYVKKKPGFFEKPGFCYLDNYMLLRRATNFTTAKTKATWATMAIAHLPTKFAGNIPNRQLWVILILMKEGACCVHLLLIGLRSQLFLRNDGVEPVHRQSRTWLLLTNSLFTSKIGAAD